MNARRWLGAQVSAPFVVAVVTDHLLGLYGALFVATVAALWLATRDPIRAAHGLNRIVGRQLSGTAIEALARLICIGLAALYGWTVNDPAGLWWTPPLVLLGVAVPQYALFGRWTDGAMMLIGLAAVVASSALLRWAMVLQPVLAAGNAAWTGVSLLLCSAAIGGLGMGIAAHRRGPRIALIGAGAVLMFIGAGAVICALLAAHGSSVLPTLWGRNDEAFTGDFAAVGMVGLLLVTLGFIAERTSVAVHCVVPLAAAVAGVTITWMAGIVDQGVLVVLACVVLGTALSHPIASRRIRAVVASVLMGVCGLGGLAHWVFTTDRWPSAVLALLVSAGALVAVVLWIGWKTARMTDAECAALG